MPLIAVYGTLRKGSYNNKRFPMEFLMDKTITGYQMYDLGPYPMIVKTGNTSDAIKTEIYHVTTRTKEVIDAMEFGAGYIEITENIGSVLPHEVSIYAYDHIPENAKRIANGDYIEYTKSKEQTPIA